MAEEVIKIEQLKHFKDKYDEQVGGQLAQVTTQLDAKLDKADPTGTGSLSMNRAAGSVVGTYSTTLGQNNIALGQYSVAEGNSTMAIGDYSHIEGNNGVAGEGSHVEGNGTIYTLQKLTGSGTSYSYSGRTDLGIGNVLYYNGIFAFITNIDKANSTLEVDVSLGTLNNTNTILYYHAANDVSHIEGSNNIASNFSHAEGGTNRAYGSCSHVEGSENTVAGANAHGEGEKVNVTGKVAHGEGYQTTASGDYSHAEGYYTTASGYASHAEGRVATASGSCSHAEGDTCKAEGYYSHAEGYESKAQGRMSHAEGGATIAHRYCQHTFGECNIQEVGDTESRGTYVEIVGNGENPNNRSNARTLDWSGNERLQGTVYVNCNSDSTGGSQVVSQADIEGTGAKLYYTWDETTGTLNFFTTKPNN